MFSCIDRSTRGGIGLLVIAKGLCSPVVANIYMRSRSKITIPKEHRKMIVQINPVACPRPRVTKSGRVYYPKKYRDWIKEMKVHLSQMTLPEGVPIHIDVVFVFHRPQRLPRYGDRVIHHKRPDLDNCVKALLDALPLKDDCVVFSITAKKYYAAWNESPNIEIHIEPK